MKNSKNTSKPAAKPAKPAVKKATPKAPPKPLTPIERAVKINARKVAAFEAKKPMSESQYAFELLAVGHDVAENASQELFTAIIHAFKGLSRAATPESLRKLAAQMLAKVLAQGFIVGGKGDTVTVAFGDGKLTTLPRRTDRKPLVLAHAYTEEQKEARLAVLTTLEETQTAAEKELDKAERIRAREQKKADAAKAKADKAAAKAKKAEEKVAKPKAA